MRQEDGLFVKPPDDLKKKNTQVLRRNYSDSDIKRQHTFGELSPPSTSGGQDILCSHFWVRKWQKWEVQGQVGHGLSLPRKWHSLCSDTGSMGEILLLLSEFPPLLGPLHTGPWNWRNFW